MKYTIKGYHGDLPDNKMLALGRLKGCKRVDVNTWEYDGYVDHVITELRDVGGMIAIYPPDNLIYVTQYNSFGAR